MKLYNCMLFVNGDRNYMKEMLGVTAAEIVLLRHIHKGADAVTNVEPAGRTNRSDAQERARLAQIYGSFQGLQGDQLIERVFGVSGIPLPQDADPPEPPSNLVEPEEPIRRSRRAEATVAA